jgi:hypothetical protein
LLNLDVPFGIAHTYTITLRQGEKGVQLWFDGLPQDSRARAVGTMAFEEFTVGARCYSLNASPPYAQGWFDGDIAEVLIYSRVLIDAERVQVETYLTAKNTPQNFVGKKPVPLAMVSNTPPVQMFVPGFTVQELPVTLNNINDIKYRPDGKLVALGYDGRVWLLTDTDGDGLEDKASVFWDQTPLLAPIGMALTPPGYAKGDGVFAVAKGKLVLLVDTNRDGVADEEIIVAQNWQPMDFNHGVDALGVAVDKDGSVYFGIGTANYTSGYRIDPTNGRSLYDLKR